MSAAPRDSLSRGLALTPAPAALRDWHFFLALALPLLFWIAMRQMLAPHTTAHTPSFWINQVVLIPILEELLFRGWLQGNLLRREALRRRCCELSAANLLTAIIFSAAHFFTHPPLWAASVIVPALVFGYFRERHNSVYPAMALHVYYNGGYFAFLG